MNVAFDTTQYEFSHGKTPRGFGSWAFCEHRACDVTDPTLFFVNPSRTYREAKAKAVKRMKEKYGPRCRGTLYVCP